MVYIKDHAKSSKGGERSPQNVLRSARIPKEATSHSNEYRLKPKQFFSVQLYFQYIYRMFLWMLQGGVGIPYTNNFTQALHVQTFGYVQFIEVTLLEDIAYFSYKDYSRLDFLNRILYINQSFQIL